MDPLVPAFLIGLLAEFGDKTQLLVCLLAARFGRPGAVLAGVALAAAGNSLLAGWGGALLHPLVGDRALTLFLAIALLSIGAAAFWPQRTVDTARDWRMGAFLTSAIAFAILELGDKTQFATAALAARSGSTWLAAVGATLGILVANLPAAALGPALASRLPIRGVRIAVGILFLIVGGWVALAALLLI